MASKIQHRRGTAAEWVSANPVLSSGEIGFETDTKKFKIGNGSLNWNSLPYPLADFDFETDGLNLSTITVHNHDMEIRTTRDDAPEGESPIDADISINSSDDVWVYAQDDIHLYAADDVEITTGYDGEESYNWEFTNNGRLSLPASGAYIDSDFNSNLEEDSRVVVFPVSYTGSPEELNKSASVLLPVNESTLWLESIYFVNQLSSVSVTLADQTVLNPIAIYDGTSQGTPAVIVQWSGDITKTASETYPLTISATKTDYVDYSKVIIGTGGSSWEFRQNEGIKFPDNTVQATAYTGGEAANDKIHPFAFIG
jgi:hypothetical protein